MKIELDAYKEYNNDTRSYEGYIMNCLEEIIANISTKRVFIQTHNFPDPDAMACAYGLFELLKAKGVDAEIVIRGVLIKQ